MRVLAEGYQQELTEELQRLYVLSLLEIPTEKLRRVLAVGLWRWKFFPRLSEIRELAEEIETNVEAHAKAYALLQTCYEKAYQEGRMPQAMRSVQDADIQDEVKQLLGESLPRMELIKRGLAEPRVMSEAELIAERDRQTSGLLEHVRAKTERRPCGCYHCKAEA